jgi:hypothetical protein
VNDVIDDSDADLPPLPDPYAGFQAPPPPRPEVSRLAITSVLAAIFLGPIGSVGAILFGWAARREIRARPAERRGMALASAGILMGTFLTVAWGGGLMLILLAARGQARSPAPVAMRPIPHRSSPAGVPPPVAPPLPTAVEPRFVAPHTTADKQVGAITLVDVGVAATSLRDELASQRAQASRAGQTMVMMTTRAACGPCEDFEASLADPLMQTALERVRLVRVDIAAFGDDLDGLRIPHDGIPGFFLLAPDLTPKDGINGGEWDDDIPSNIAPVLGAFVRGTYAARRHGWRAPPGSGMRL